MSMSKKDYVVIAEVLRKMRDSAANPDEQGLVLATAYKLATEFAQDNALFDKARFIAAVKGKQVVPKRAAAVNPDGVAMRRNR